MAVLCREFDISRKTGYKFYQAIQGLGLQGLTDRSRRPYRQANRLPVPIESLIVQLSREHPSWGAPKIREKISAGSRESAAGHQHRARGPGSAWSGQPRPAPQSPQGSKERTCPDRISPMICGALITRASSCSPITLLLSA